MQERRLALAALVVLTITAAPLLADTALGAVAPGGDFGQKGINSSALQQARTPLTALDAIAELAEGDDDELPTRFADEVGLPMGARDVRASADGSIVGYVVTGKSSEIAASERERLSSEGWTAMELGDVDGTAFMKETGDCTWMLMTCTQVGDATSVVARCPLP